MREKIIKLMSMLLAPFEHTVQGLTSALRDQILKPGYDELPANELEFVNTFEKALREGRKTITDRIVGVFEQHFTEEQIDALIAYQESAVAKHLASVSMELMTTIRALTDDWQQETLRSIEGRMKELLGVDSPAPADAPANATAA